MREGGSRCIYQDEDWVLWPVAAGGPIGTTGALMHSFLRNPASTTTTTSTRQRTPTMATLEAERTHAANLDVQILALERSLSVLRAQRTLIQEQLDSYKYPVLLLPTEIVCEIFHHFLPVYPECPPLAGVLSPTNLTQICRKWRAIALDTPTLWRAMHMSLKECGFPLVQQIHELDIWLSRSFHWPFSIEIKEPDDASLWNPASSLCNFIFSPARCARWEHLKVDLLEPPLFAIKCPLPLLRHLDVGFRRGAQFDDANPTVFEGVPLLRSVVLDGYSAPMVVLPWAQLTSLKLHRIYPEECVEVLEQTTNLVYCHLTLFVVPDPSGPWPDVTLPRLESLHILQVSRYARFPITGYLETLIVPTLRQLEIRERILENPIESITSFILKSGCKLQEVFIVGERLVSKDNYRRAFPSVKLSFEEKFVGEGADTANDVEDISHLFIHRVRGRH
ncbi:hypothetical protein C8F04DRAFT_1111430 [Mycena alexandri]|uniref:F-box domain-containing protein n=1 Tax=Mycena alexandri TaxID=1745969 RepID=A0AAD6SQI1_9AGAR|nr:hypothetical protein C8F04DRAFT_1111430 [Mycena alexandri]